MAQYRKRILLWSLLLVLSVMSRSNIVNAQYQNMSDGAVGNNYGYAGKLNSYLAVNGSNLVRVEALGSSKGVLIETFDESFHLQSQKTMSYELPLFGGFYASEKYYFLVFGDFNPEEDDSVEVLRVVKYDKDWNRLGSGSVYGANTCTMFSSAGLDMTDNGSLLYIRTGHTMYKYSDGYNHQASVLAEVDMETCNVNKCLSSIAYEDRGYVSHSFNEKLVYDAASNYLYSSDLGDAYPRCNVVHKYLSVGTTYSSTSTKWVSALEYGGVIGDNFTGSTLGGFTDSSSTLLVAGSTIDQANFNVGTASSSNSYNVYVSVIDKGSFTKTKTIYYTNYDDESNLGHVSAPQIVKISDDCFLLMWETMLSYSAYSGEINYVYIDSDGKKLSEVRSLKGSIAKCQPVVYNNQVVWYYAKNSRPVFYCLPINPSEEINAPEIGFQAVAGNIIYEVTGEETARIVGYTENLSGAVTIPDTVDLGGYSYTVSGIEAEAFKDSEITSITIPAGIVEIGDNILQGCNALTTVNNKTNIEVTLPEMPVKEGYHFVMWRPSNSYTPITTVQSATAYAYFTTITYTVNFDSQGGSEVDSQTPYIYEYASEPAAPEKEGYIFGGWYTSAQYYTKWDFSSNRKTYNTTVTLYAKWLEDVRLSATRLTEEYSEQLTIAGSGYVWYQFTAPETATYSLTIERQANSSAGSYIDIEGYTDFLQSAEATLTYENSVQLEQGATYYYRLRNRSSLEKTVMMHYKKLKEISSIEIVSPPNTTEYTTKSITSLSMSGLSISVIYSDTTTESVNYGTISELTGTGIVLKASTIPKNEDGTYVIGDTYVECTYQGASFQVPITIQPYPGDTAIEIGTFEDVPLNISNSGDYQWYTFTPLVTAVYTIASTGANDPILYLYSSDGKTQLAKHDDIGSGNYNFSLEYEMTAGTIYRIKVEMYGRYSSQASSFRITKDVELKEHKVLHSPKKVYYNGMDTLEEDKDYLEGLQIQCTYDTGNSEVLTPEHPASAITGKSLSCSVEQDEENPDTYQIVVSYMNQIMYEGNVTVKSLADIPQNELGETVTFQQEETIYFALDCQKEGDYYINLDSDKDLVVDSVVDVEGNEITSDIVSRNDEITVSFTIQETGTIYVKCHLEEDGNLTTGDINVVTGKAKAFEDYTITTSDEEFIYDGTEKTFQTVTVSDGENILVEGTDYVLNYSNNIFAGKATLTVKGCSCYKGSLTKDFVIKKAQCLAVVPKENMEVDYSTSKVSDISLEAYPGWCWDNSIAEQELQVEIPFSATVRYNGSDAGSYEKVTAVVTILRNACNHIVVEDEAREATCYQIGLTAGSHCKVCGKILKEQRVINVLNHKWDDGYVYQEAIGEDMGIIVYTCELCGAHYYQYYYAEDSQENDGDADEDWDYEEDMEEDDIISATSMSLKASVKGISSVPISSTYKLAPKKTLTLKVAFAPENAEKEAVTFKSSNTKVATVNSKGKITAKKAGKATITVTSENGLKKSFKVQVMKKAVSKVKIKASKKTIKVRKTVKLKAETSPSKKYASTKVFWKSSNSKIATVSSSGTVKGLKKGKVKITAIATDGSGKKATITINVK